MNKASRPARRAVYHRPDLMQPTHDPPLTTRRPETGADDYALMESVAAGDASALAALYDRHKAMLFSLSLRVLKDRGEAEQALLDLFIDLWQRPDRYDAARGSPLVYLVMLTRSRAIDRRRSREARARAARDVDARFEAAVGNQTNAGPLEQMVAGEQGQKVRAALAALDGRQREAIELSFFDGLSHGEIATRLGRPLGTIKTNIRSGLIRLRDLLRT